MSEPPTHRAECVFGHGPRKRCGHCCGQLRRRWRCDNSTTAGDNYLRLSKCVLFGRIGRSPVLHDVPCSRIIIVYFLVDCWLQYQRHFIRQLLHRRRVFFRRDLLRFNCGPGRILFRRGDCRLQSQRRRWGSWTQWQWRHPPVPVRSAEEIAVLIDLGRGGRCLFLFQCRWQFGWQQ